MIQREVLSLFPTNINIFKTNLDTKKILKLIKEFKSKNPESANKSNIGGWHSTGNIMLDSAFHEVAEVQNKCIQAVLERYKPVNFFVNGCWININKGGDYNTSHLHPGSNLSACLYVKVPSGAIIFEDPRQYVEMELGRYESCEDNYLAYQILPEEGDFIVFPSWLKHSVSKSGSQKERVTIATNYSVNIIDK